MNCWLACHLHSITSSLTTQQFIHIEMHVSWNCCSSYEYMILLFLLLYYYFDVGSIDYKCYMFVRIFSIHSCAHDCIHICLCVYVCVCGYLCMFCVLNHMPHGENDNANAFHINLSISSMYFLLVVVVVGLSSTKSNVVDFQVEA